MDSPYFVARLVVGVILVLMGVRGYRYGLNDLTRFPRNLTGTPALVTCYGFIIGGLIMLASAFLVTDAEMQQTLTVIGLILPLPVLLASVIVYSRAHPELRRPPEKQG